jgi:hypothetical protein
MCQLPFGDDFAILVDCILFDNAQGRQYGIRDGVDGLPWVPVTRVANCILPHPLESFQFIPNGGLLIYGCLLPGSH